MASDINLLILDEPTNHLDLPSREWIENALGSYGEALIFISHDRYFIDRFATRIWEIDNSALTDFSGTFAEYTAYKTSVSAPEPAKKMSSARLDKKTKPADAQKELRRLEREIGKLENELDEINLQKEEHSSFYEKLLELDKQEKEALAALDGYYLQWDEAAGQE